MKYTFNDILSAEIYEDTRVMFVLGKYTWFNNMVCDTLKALSIDSDEKVEITSDLAVSSEFGIDMEDTDDSSGTNSVDFNTFMDVIGVSNINGKWFCKVSLQSLNKKQKEKLMRYIKDPSDTGILVVVSDNWLDYKDILRNRALSFSKVSHLIQLSFPNKNILKSIVQQSFEEKEIEIDNGAVEFFIMRMSSAYGDYEKVINDIVDIHKESTLDKKQIKEYMKGIENFVLDDYIMELTKPMSSEKTNSKKVLKIMMALEDEIGAKNLVYQILKSINKYIEYRLLINKGYIPIGINYFFKDILNGLPENIRKDYEKMNERKFRYEAYVASRTSLRDWEYMKLILSKAIENNRMSEDEMDAKCQKALYELSTRSVLKADRLNNILGVDNILTKKLDNINKIIYKEQPRRKEES